MVVGEGRAVVEVDTVVAGEGKAVVEVGIVVAEVGSHRARRERYCVGVAVGVGSPGGQMRCCCKVVGGWFRRWAGSCRPVPVSGGGNSSFC